MKDNMKTYSLDEVKDKVIGKKGTVDRDLYEQELSLEVLGDAIKRARKERNLTQEQLGDLIGVKKAQISKLESNANNVTLSTVLRVFKALKASVSFNIEMDNDERMELV